MVGVKPATPEAYKLIHDGSVALSRVEANGVRLDRKYLVNTMEGTSTEAKRLLEELREDEVYKVWRKHYGEKLSFNSGDQLGHILFDIMGHPSPGYTDEKKEDKRKERRDEKKEKRRRHKTDEASLSKIQDLPFLTKYLQLKKVYSGEARLKGLWRELCDDDLVHCIINLHTAVTYRSSVDTPNLQNIPRRNKYLKKLVRTAFIPRSGRVLLEIDFKGVEVRVAACYNKDPVLIDYILDPTTDMHRDIGAQCYMIKPENVHKDVRDTTKNKFVFPQFYGSDYINCAQDMWEAILMMNLTTVKGTPIGNVLQRRGIDELGSLDRDVKPGQGTFTRHLQTVQDDMWNRRFKVYSTWKNSFYNAYRKKGWFDTLTGFVCQGLMSKNDVNNYPIQGSAFHCLLWCLIQLQKEIKRRGMKSLIVLQIHDSILIDAVESEVAEIVAMAREIMTKAILKHWKWLIVPLEVEVELSTTNWGDKSEYTGAIVA